MGKVESDKKPRGKELWFKAKHYGYGWCPSTWQGWIILLSWAILFSIILVSFNEENFVCSFLSLGLITAILYFICYKKGEKARWRWGK